MIEIIDYLTSFAWLEHRDVTALRADVYIRILRESYSLAKLMHVM